MLELEEARSRILAGLPPATTESVRLREAHQRISAEVISSPQDLPLFDNSAMDGFAVRAGDVSAGNPQSPVRLRLIGRVAAGGSFSGELDPGQSVRIFTGSPLPRGSDAVVMQEDTRTDAGRPEEVQILEPV